MWKQPAYTKQFPKDLTDSYAESLKAAVISPAFSRFFEAMDILRAQMQRVILKDTDLDTALNFTQKEWERIMSEWKEASN